ncbi:MAG: phospholipase A [Sulfurimonadaceae bacterium]
MILRTVLTLLMALSLYAADEEHRAEAYFQNEEYKKAYDLYLQSTNDVESPEAAYKLGWMYENGKGVEQDPDKAIYWYKKAAKWDLAETNKERVYETIYRNLDPVGDEESMNTLVQMANGKFGLRAYYPNYAVVSYTDKVPRGDAALDDPTIDGTHYINTETKFQISLRADYMTEWFGFSQMWTGAYTQTSYWQLFIESSPFRETNYKPELFVTFPFYHALDAIHMKAISFGYKHASNGQSGEDENATREYEDGPYEGSRSRSWNRLYIRGIFQWENFFAEVTVWRRMKEKYETDDNPNITDFYGNGSLELGYIHKKLLTRLTLRPSFSNGNFTGELEMSYPLPASDNVFFYLQGFSGYGQSLIDYDQHVNQVGLGLSISR